MTRTRRTALTEVDALRLLFGNAVANLTPEGYEEAMSRLRRTEPNAARRVERALAPLLERVFPRRRRRWWECSEGTWARLELVAENPYVAEDVTTIRDVLGIPADQIHVSANHPWLQHAVESLEPETAKRVVEGNVAKRAQS